MKRYFFGTNMKMYKNTEETRYFMERLALLVKTAKPENVTLFVIPSFPSLEVSGRILDGSGILLGAQNMHWEEQGQFSGEVSGRMLADIGVSMVMIGHSERRHVFNETDSDLNKKIVSAANQDLIPLLCIGETKTEKEAGVSDEVLRMQLKQDLYGFPENKISSLRIAYEPVWAIGTGGVPAPADYVGEKHRVIRECLREMYGSAGNDIPVLFGGSVNPQNAPGYLKQPDVDGLFVGRSAWNADDYYNLVTQLFG